MNIRFTILCACNINGLGLIHGIKIARTRDWCDLKRFLFETHVRFAPINVFTLRRGGGGGGDTLGIRPTNNHFPRELDRTL